MACIKSGAHIRVQVESVKRRKIEGGGTKRRLSVPVKNGKENFDPHTIPSRKKKKGKKEHNLSKNVSKGIYVFMLW